MVQARLVIAAANLNAIFDDNIGEILTHGKPMARHKPRFADKFAEIHFLYNATDREANVYSPFEMN